MALCQADKPHLIPSRFHQHNINRVVAEKGTTMKTIAEARDVAPTTNKVEEEAVATEEIAAMPATPKRDFQTH